MSDFPNEYDVLRDIVQRLETARIPYMLTGSLALSFYVEPRMTRDIDVVVELGQRTPASLVPLFEPDYYVSADGIADAIAHGTLFNLIHQGSVLKVDCIIRDRTAAALRQFSRRQRLRIRDFETWVISKEDLIVAKLGWSAQSGSERQMLDVRQLVASGFDENYVLASVRELGLESHWRQLAPAGYDAGGVRAVPGDDHGEDAGGAVYDGSRDV